jgi:hypothetical protein
MSIVPSSEELIIEAQVTQVDRKAVHSGLQAQIHLSAYSSRRAENPRHGADGLSGSPHRQHNPSTLLPRPSRR